MSSSESEAAEAAARSLALEQAYVHEVYEQCAEATLHASNWPRVQQFLEQLEPGALVADIGCGNGKYLSVNHNVFKIGVDRCTKFTSIAREKDNEVLACDNLSLPFRDESFDAVLSIAVVHHFSTTERRVRALKELARVLRIGGRLVISVWAMEQKHRKFESQDVLVPWPKAYCINPNGSPMKPRGMSYDDRQRGKNAQTYLLSKRSSQRGGGKGGKSYWIDPIFSPSPSTSSLSSPNETCYSFFRRALQKLAGGRRNSRAWFLENWQNGSANGFYSHANGHSSVNGVNCGLDYDDEDNVDELPIELRRLEEPRPRHHHHHQSLQKQLSDSLSVKSKSVGNISELHKCELVRSRSSATGLCNPDAIIANGVEDVHGDIGSVALPPPRATSNERESFQSRADVCTSRPSSRGGGTQSPQPTKPRLVKQKTHFSDDACLDYAPEPSTAIDRSLRDIPETQVASHQSVSSSCNDTSGGGSSSRRNVHKQSSMNEELMSIERLKERESVRRNIMKQASLNEELMYKSRPTFEAFKDTLYSGSARFQLLKSGLTNRIKQSTNNIEKVSGMSIKNGFVRILQSWKSTESPTSATTTSTTTNSCNSAANSCSTPNSSSSSSGKTPDLVERRPSREDGSDSSKDSSLQSDTSVDSEDSFASVIYIPKKSPSPLLEVLPPIPPINPDSSAPVSPLLLKQVGVGKAGVSAAGLMKRLPVASSKSLPPRSPPAPISPRAVSSAPGTGAAQPRFFAAGEQMLLLRQSSDSTSQRNALLDRIAEARRSFDAQLLTRQESTNGARKVNGAGTEIAARPLARPAPHQQQLPQQQQQQQPQSEVLCPSDPARLTRSFSCSGGSSQASSTRSHLTRCSSLSHHYHYHQHQPQPPPPIVEERRSSLEDDGQPLTNDAIDEALEQLSETSLDPEPATNSTSSSTSSSSSSANTAVSNTAASSSTEDDDSRARRLNEIKQLLRSKPGFASRARSTGAVFPLVRRANSTSSPSSTSGKTSKPVPKLASLELFNPETDDPDSDSSGVSSPESAGSVISVISDAERYLASKASSSSGGSGDSKKAEGASGSDEKGAEVESSASSSNEANPSNADPDSDSPGSGGDGSSGSSDKGQMPSAAPLLLQQTVDSIALKHASDARPTDVATTTTRPTSLDKHISPVESTWNEECKRQLIDLTDRLNENLINDIDQFCQRTKLELENESDASSLASKRNRYSDTGRSQSAPKQQITNSNSGGASVAPGPVSNGGGGGIGGSSCSSSEDSGSLRRLCSASTASLASSSLGRALHTRSASEETPCTSSTSSSGRRERARLARNSQSAATSTCSSSQESLPSDQITYHQYYHVFREGELEQLIDAHIDSLHIISSYYEHASWCLVAEKVQVWTI